MTKLTNFNLIILLALGSLTSSWATSPTQNNSPTDTSLNNTSTQAQTPTKQTISNKTRDPNLRKSVSYTPGNALSVKPQIVSGIISPLGVKLAKEQVLTRNLKVNPVTLDPDKMSDRASIGLSRSLFDTLVRQLPTGEYVGAAAQSYSSSPDGLTWTFKLRPNATWSNGQPVTAQDFVYAWQRLVNPSSGSAYADYLANANVKNALAIAQGKLPPQDLGVEAKDKFTFVIHLTQATPWLPELVAFNVLAPVPKQVVEKYGDKWTQLENFVGNGPYRITQYIVNGHISLKKRNDYWDAKNVHITDSKFIFNTNINSIYNMYLANELPTADIPPNLWNKVLKQRPDELKEYFDPVIFSVDFNLKRIPNPKVREALKLLIDNRFLTNKILKAGEPTSIFVPTFLQDAQLATQEDYFNTPYKQNIAKAKQLLREAGYSKEHPLKISLTTMRQQLLDQIIVAFLGWFNQNSGGLVELKPIVLDNNSYEATIQNKDFDMRLGERKADYDQASALYNVLLCSNTQNYTNWCSQDYDHYVTLANKTADPQLRAQYYAKANQIIQKDTPVIPLYVKSAYLLQSPALGGLSLKVKRRYLRDYFIIADKKVAPNH